MLEFFYVLTWTCFYAIYDFLLIKCETALQRILTFYLESFALQMILTFYMYQQKISVFAYVVGINELRS